jgi:ferredoxin
VTIGRTIVVDPIACDGHGLCAELFPERISPDDWGYPIIDPAEIGADLERAARRAVAQCPTRALRITNPPNWTKGRDSGRASHEANG